MADTTPQKTTSTTEHKNLNTGPVLAILIIVLVCILGGLYLWGSTLAPVETTPPARTIPNNEPETPRAEADRQILETTSPSNDLDAIYADLESTSLESIDAELGTIDAELGTTLP